MTLSGSSAKSKETGNYESPALAPFSQASSHGIDKVLRVVSFQTNFAEHSSDFHQILGGYEDLMVERNVFLSEYKVPVCLDVGPGSIQKGKKRKQNKANGRRAPEREGKVKRVGSQSSQTT